MTTFTGVVIFRLTFLCSVLMRATETFSSNRDVISTARCRVRCLSHLLCMGPCSQPIPDPQLCSDVCKAPNELICLESCQFLNHVKAEVQGTCPTDDSTSTCGMECTVDTDCDIYSSCCSRVACGRSCQASMQTRLDLPGIPETPKLRERPKGGSVELHWNHSVDGNVTSPVLFIVDSRWNVGRNHEENGMTPWQQVAQTTTNFATVNDIIPGHWYEFRVSSVNIHGTRGPSTPTAPFTLSKEPRRPGPPTNLTEGDTLLAGGGMAIMIHWLPPKKSDLPITRYKVFWSKYVRSSSLSSIYEQRKVLPGSHLSFQITNLESETTYFVQVQAMCQYGDLKLKSDKAGVYVTTFPLPKILVPHLGGSFRPLPTPAAVTNLTVGQPFYDDSGKLKANVSWSRSRDMNNIASVQVTWSPEACIAGSSSDNEGLSQQMSARSMEEHLVIMDLRTDCRYVVKVETLSTKGIIGSPNFVTFITPSCGEASPDCLRSVSRAPKEPPNFRHSFLISGSNITSRISWGIPESDSPITGFQIFWGPLLRTHQSKPAIDKTSTYTRALSKDVRTVNIENLLEGTTYLVQVQGRSRMGAGEIASMQFATPLLQVLSLDSFESIGSGSSNEKKEKKKPIEPSKAPSHSLLHEASPAMTCAPKLFARHTISMPHMMSSSKSILADWILTNVIILYKCLQFLLM